MASGGKSVLFSGHNYGSGGDYQIIDAGVWLYGNLVDAFKISGGSIATGLDLSETTVSGQDIEFSGGGTLVSAANSVTFDDIVTAEDFKVTGDNGSALADATGLAVVNSVSGLNRTVITLTDYSLTLTDSEGNGAHGSVKLIDFPEGIIQVLGAIGDLALTAATGIAATATYDIGLGTETIGVGDAVLSGAEVDIVAKVEGDLTGSAVTVDMVADTSATFDGHSTADDVWFNVAIEDDDVTGTGAVTVNGTIVVSWLNLGDY